MKAPFPYFGGKSRVAGVVWSALGNVQHYVEPFFGSGAVLFARPHEPRVETVNDADGLLCNVWRSTSADPDAVLQHVNGPTSELDLHARHAHLIERKAELTEALRSDPEYFDAKLAGWWIWGARRWIGSGWGGKTSQQIPQLSSDPAPITHNCLIELSQRLKRVRVACGDWARVLTPSALYAGGGVKGVFLDPPYAPDGRASVYAHESDVWKDVQDWCLSNGRDDKMRIVLAGYAGEHDALESHGWTVHKWATSGGYGMQCDGRGRINAARERLWMSPHCIRHQEHSLFSAEAEA